MDAVFIFYGPLAGCLLCLLCLHFLPPYWSSFGFKHDFLNFHAPRATNLNQVVNPRKSVNASEFLVAFFPNLNLIHLSVDCNFYYSFGRFFCFISRSSYLESNGGSLRIKFRKIFCVCLVEMSCNVEAICKEVRFLFWKCFLSHLKFV